MQYFVWTEGCQMNAADSQRLEAALEGLGYAAAPRADEVDVIVLNTCVVRQSAEDKAYGRLSSLRPLKEKNPTLVIAVMGCLVGVRGNDRLKQRFPYIDVFAPPSDPSPIVEYLSERLGRVQEVNETSQRFATMDGELRLPAIAQGRQVAVFIPVVYGCSYACTYCIIPYKRGVERSRPAEEILTEVRALTDQGVREVTLLGQIVDRYGLDQPGSPSLPQLLRQLQEVDGLVRVRFLTSHPNWLTDDLIDTVAELPKVMPHIEVPSQSGDDGVLAAMHRGYTDAQYRALVEKIRARIPGVSIATDIIVGFPGETEEQFQHTVAQLADLKLDVAHLARYSPREGTVSARRMTDDVPAEEKWRRFRLLEELQEGIASEIHAGYVGKTTEVLFEEKAKGRWRGRTPTNKLVFVETEEDLHGQVRPVEITWAGAWSMRGKVV